MFRVLPVVFTRLVTRIERNAALENPRYLEYLRDRLEGHMQIVVAISLVLDNLQGFQELKDMFENLLQSFWELLQDIRNKITLVVMLIRVLCFGGSPPKPEVLEVDPNT